MGKRELNMKRAVLVFLAVAIQAGWSHAEVKLEGKTTFVFATIDEGKKILSTKDDFVEGMSPFDRAARLKSDQEVSTEEILTHYGQNVRLWSDSEKQVVEAALVAVKPRLEALHLPFPPTITLIKTTATFEGGAAYTRGTAMILPKGCLAKGDKVLQRLLVHELFHILTRTNPELRDRLYQVIGFVKCNEIELPAELKLRKISNPDAIRNDHLIQVKSEGKEYRAIPVIFSRTLNYDVNRGGEFFDYLQFRLLVVEPGAWASLFQPQLEEGKMKFLEVRQVQGFFEKVGKNTQYIIHPEEILADNFAILVCEIKNAPSPEIVAKLKQALGEKRPAKPKAA